MAKDIWDTCSIPVEGGDLFAAYYAPTDANASPHPVLVLHGNGMNGWCHRSLVSEILGKFPIYLVDLRGHGKSTLPAQANHQVWRQMHRDAEAIHAFLTQRHSALPHGIGHSLGALLMLEALNRGHRFESLTLIEPVLLSPFERFLLKLTHVLPFMARYNLRQTGAAKRRSDWPDLQSVRESYLTKSFFTRFDQQVFDDYLAHGFKETESGLTLSCTPALESAIFRYLDIAIINATRNSCENTSLIIGTTESSTVSKQGLKDAQRRFPNLNLVRVKGEGHFVPFNKPQVVRDHLALLQDTP